MDRHDHRLTDHVGLAQARPNNRVQVHTIARTVLPVSHFSSPARNAISVITSDMQGMVWGEPELSHMWVFDHMVFFQS